MLSGRLSCRSTLGTLIVLPFLASGQSTSATGTFQGSVADLTGAAVSGAMVSVRNEETTATRKTQTDAGGQFTVRSLPIGTYTASVQAEGFATVQVNHFCYRSGK